MSSKYFRDRTQAGLHIVEDAWYAVLESRRVRRVPVTIERLGRRFVLWRDEHGKVVAADPDCPHRGADLGQGRVVDGRLECPYHGFRFAPDGACTLMPCEGRMHRIRADLRLGTYPVREQRGIVWLYWGAPQTELPDTPWFDKVPRDDRHSWTRSKVWNASFPRVMEGNLDIHHFPFLHRSVAWGVGTLLDPYEATLEGDVIRTRGVLRKDDGAPYSGRGGLALELSVRFPGLLFGRVGTWGVGIAAFTPIDQGRTFVLLRYYAPIPVVGRLLAWLGGMAEALFVLPDDERILGTSAPQLPDSRSSKLVRADAGIALWHKLYQRSRHRAEESPVQLPLDAAIDGGTATS